MGKLFPFQREGVKFLRAHKRAYLADEMGLGKTVQAVVASTYLRTMAGHFLDPMRVLIVCPASVVENWKREWQEWGGFGEPVVVSYSMLVRQRLARQCVDDLDFDLVILDEAHYCKTPGSKRTKVALQIAARAERVWLLSGTPMPNDPRELWPIFKALWPSFPRDWGIRTAFQWMDRFCKWSDSDYGQRVWGTTPRANTELAPAIKTFMLRRRLRDVGLELPPLRFTIQYMDKDPRLAEELEELGASMDDEHLSILRRVLGTYKAPRVAKIIMEEMDEDLYNDIVVMYWHHDTGDALREYFKAAMRSELLIHGFDGSTSVPMRQVEIDRFQREGGIFLAQQGAAGIGITLTRATEIVLVEPAWSPEDNAQAIKRIHRIGQDNPCRARVFAVPGSLDEQLMAVVARKQGMIEEVFNG